MLYEAHGISRFIVVCGYTDLRKGISGLAQIIEGNYHLDPFETNTLFLFCGKRGDRIKALLWKENGFLRLYKRWERGTLSSIFQLDLMDGWRIEEDIAGTRHYLKAVECATDKTGDIM